MSNCALFLSLLAGAFSNLFAADSDLVEISTTEIASVIAKDLRSAFVNEPFYSDQLAGLDRDSVAQQISLYQASCMVEAFIRLAQRHSVELEDILVGAPVVVDTDGLPDREVREETADCSRNAFIATGIKIGD